MEETDNTQEPAPPPVPEIVAPPPPKPMRLGEKLISLGLLSSDQLGIVLTEQKTSKKLMGAILVEMGFITESALGEVLAESSGAQKFDPKAIMLDSSVVRLVPKEIAARHKIIPVAYDGAALTLAMADVYNVLAIDQLLTPKALAAVRRFCRESTIWNNIKPGYLGAYFFDGFCSELLLRLAWELRAHMPRVIKDFPLNMMWGYKCDCTLPGLAVHADAAAP